MGQSQFNAWYNTIIASKSGEGGISNRSLKDDPGGLTNHGITLKVFQTSGAKLVNLPPTKEGLMQLTAPQAGVIAKNLYWDRYKIDTIVNHKFQPIVADSYFNGGGINSLGFKNISALNGSNVSVSQLLNNRLAYLKKLSNWDANKNGWTDRLNKLASLADSIGSGNLTVIVLILIAGILLWKS